jgi:hypothetical protein
MEVWRADVRKIVEKGWLERTVGPKLSTGQSAARENFARPKVPELLHLATSKQEPLNRPNSVANKPLLLNPSAYRVLLGQLPSLPAKVILVVFPQRIDFRFSSTLFPSRCWGAWFPG